MQIENKTSKEKISIAECKQILCKDGRVLSDAEITSIRDFLYHLAEIDIEVFYYMEKKENYFKNKKEKSLEDTDDISLQTNQYPKTAA